MKKTYENTEPYKECANCRQIGDCPHPDIDCLGMMGDPMCPDCCPKPIDIMKETLKTRKKRNAK